VEKRDQLILDKESGGLKRIDVNPRDRQRAALSDEEVIQVAKATLEVESMYAQPQDIEFCFSDDNQLFLLQTRPISLRSQEFQGDDLEPQHAALGNHVVWDNSNIIESYSGVTTPMTFSFIRRAYSIVYHCFSEVMGISPHVVHEHRDAFDNMLGLFHGRVYYNLKNWYRLVRMFPGYHYNRHFMESMMGVKESLSLDEEQAPVGFLRKWMVEFPALLKLLSRTSWNFLRIRATVDRFQRHFYQYYDQWSQIDFNSIPPHEMLRLHDMMEQKMLWNWKAPIINDFYVMIFYGMLRKMCGSWCGDKNASLQNGLICGEGGLQSDEPAKLLIRMTRLVQNDHALRDRVLNEPVEDLPQLIAADCRFERFNQLMSRYLDEFGLRCADELKLESYSYQDQPHRLYSIIRNYLIAKNPSTCDLDAIEHREREIRHAAEQTANEMLSKSRSWIPRRILFRWVLNNARLGVRNRENMRFARTRIYGILRRMLRSIGQHFADEGILDDREDVFYLTIEEVWDFVKGTAVTTDLRGLANFRKTEYDAYRHETVLPPDDRFATFGMAYHGNQFHTRDPSHALKSDNSLSGIGCCPGIVMGTVQLVRDPASDTYFQGDILVAQRTEPGWVPFFPAFSGILVERGSVLSHSAIVAREMGIPTIVGITGLTQRLRSGQRIRMDGRTGTIQILAER
jgi:pyruvate,water dikinase